MQSKITIVIISKKKIELYFTTVSCLFGLHTVIRVSILDIKFSNFPEGETKKKINKNRLILITENNFQLKVPTTL